MQKQPTGVFFKKGAMEISKNSQENICTGKTRL